MVPSHYSGQRAAADLPRCAAETSIGSVTSQHSTFNPLNPKLAAFVNRASSIAHPLTPSLHPLHYPNEQPRCCRCKEPPGAFAVSARFARPSRSFEFVPIREIRVAPSNPLPGIHADSSSGTEGYRNLRKGTERYGRQKNRTRWPKAAGAMETTLVCRGRWPGIPQSAQICEIRVATPSVS